MKSLRDAILPVLLALNGFAAETQLELELDPAATGKPINPFIYGQFIEHLGRCIYGGIWAEMLEDRKFFHPITPAYAPYAAGDESLYPVVAASPWEILGDPTGVEMTREDPFTGKHAPVVRAGSGIRQNDLGVRAGVACNGYVWAKPLGGNARLRVTLGWGDGQTAAELTFLGEDYSRQVFALTPAKTTERGARFSVEVLEGNVTLGPPSLMPSDNVDGLRADTLALLKKLNGTIYRWPGGNFVSGYNWRDGIGDRDRRPPRKNPAWSGVEHNDFGTDEFIAFCRRIGTVPMIAVNTGFGDAYSAAQWVEYVNGAPDTVAGAWRVANGHIDPYGVDYWCVGNEMFGHWQLGYMPISHYTLKHNEVAEAMWAMNPGLTLVGVGDLDTLSRQYDGNTNNPYHGMRWSEGMLRFSGDHMSMLSEHIYCGRVPWTQDGRKLLPEHVDLIKLAIRGKAEGHRELQASLPELKGRIIPIAMDEWNYWHRDYEYGELGCVYDLADALGLAVGLHEYFRQSDIIQMAHYAQTVNVIGAIKTSRIAAAMEGTGLVLQLYRKHYGSIPLRLADSFAPYDIASALTADGRAVTVGVVNPTDQTAGIKLSMPRTISAIHRWHLSGTDEFVHNQPGNEPAIRIVERRHLDVAQPLEVPALSVTLFRIEYAR